jgi:hypothetical protein
VLGLINSDSRIAANSEISRYAALNMQELAMLFTSSRGIFLESNRTLNLITIVVH